VVGAAAMPERRTDGEAAPPTAGGVTAPARERGPRCSTRWASDAGGGVRPFSMSPGRGRDDPRREVGAWAAVGVGCSRRAAGAGTAPPSPVGALGRAPPVNSTAGAVRRSPGGTVFANSAPMVACSRAFASSEMDA
jgi:hypothetical protein